MLANAQFDNSPMRSVGRGGVHVVGEGGISRGSDDNRKSLCRNRKRVKMNFAEVEVGAPHMKARSGDGRGATIVTGDTRVKGTRGSGRDWRWGRRAVILHVALTTRHRESVVI